MRMSPRGNPSTDDQVFMIRFADVTLTVRHERPFACFRGAPFPKFIFVLPNLNLNCEAIA